MAKITKAACEDLLLECIQSVGLEKYHSAYGEGRKRNNEYYQFTLKDGRVKYFTNPSQAFKDALNIE